jgi:hypothetical protein
MILATARVEDFDRFWKTFTIKGAEKRKQYGSKGARVFRDPNDPNRLWTVFDWDEESFAQFRADPEMADIFKEGGLEAPPQAADPAGEHEV